MAKKLDWKVTENGCWECTSHTRDLEGYPLKFNGGRTRRLSRVLYEELFGDIPEGLKILHKCDNRACINPEHLMLGTSKENTQDMINKGRANMRESRKLTPEQREAIRNDTRLKKVIAEEYGITRQDVHKLQKRGKKTNGICEGKTY